MKDGVKNNREIYYFIYNELIKFSNSLENNK